MKKRYLSLLLVLVLVLSVTPISAMASSPVPTEQQAHDAMLALKDDYPEGMRWTNDNYYEWKGGIYSGGYGCAGFAFLLSDAAFGDLPARVLTNITIADVHVGDILRVNGDTHSVIITEVHPNYVVLAEGNFNSSIHWGRTMSPSQVAAADYMMTRYPVGTFGDAYTLTFDANGGEGGPGVAIVDSTGLTIPPRVAVRKGYTMLGWARSKTAAKADYTAGDKIHITQNTTLYAVWKEQILPITPPYPSTYSGTVNVGGELYYSITPGAAGYYTFESIGDDDTVIHLYDTSWNYLDYDDDSGEQYNFKLVEELNAGTTYYVVVKAYDSGPEFDRYYPTTNITFTVSQSGSPGHIHSYTGIVVEPTCIDPGYTIYTCSCGSSYIADSTDALGHSYGAWTIKSHPTCTDPGLEIRTCTRCNSVNSRDIPANGHTTISVVTAPTCTERGYTTHTCTVCGESYRDTYKNALGHDFHDGICTRCGAEGQDSPAPVNPFVDVKEKDYFYDPVLWAYYHEPQITNGMDSTHFAPNSTCTRAQVVTFLWRAMGCPKVENAKNPFVDVKDGAWYTDAVLWAVENGITNGTSATTFSPNTKVTRAQTVTFLYRAAKGEPVHTPNPFTDLKPGQYYTDAVLWAVENGITNGTSATTFSPDKTCTRGQIVTFLYRAMN